MDIIYSDSITISIKTTASETRLSADTLMKIRFIDGVISGLGSEKLIEALGDLSDRCAADLTF